MKSKISLNAFFNSFGLAYYNLNRIVKEMTGLNLNDFAGEYSSKFMAIQKHVFKFDNDLSFKTEYNSDSIERFNLKLTHVSKSELKAINSPLIIKWDVMRFKFGNLFVSMIEGQICFINFWEGDDDLEEGCRIGTNLNYIHRLFAPFEYTIQRAANLDEDFLFRKTQEKLYSAIDPIENGKETSYCNEKIEIPAMIISSSFQRKVWDALSKIPYAQFTTYKDIASYIGHPNAYRAVGTAVGQNPLSILLPCHRVISASGKAGGYSGGLDNKLKVILYEWMNIMSTREKLLEES